MKIIRIQKKQDAFSTPEQETKFIVEKIQGAVKLLKDAQTGLKTGFSSKDFPDVEKKKIKDAGYWLMDTISSLPDVMKGK